MRFNKTVLTAIIPIVVIIVYSLLFHVNPIDVITSTSPFLIVLFFLTYVASVGIISVRDMLITRLSYSTVFKARLLGNAVGLIIPGLAGPDLTRSVVYSLNDRGKLVEYFSLAIYEAFYDVVTISLMFILLFPLFFSPLAIPFLLVTLANIAGWGGGFAYVYIFSEKTNRLESFIFSNFRQAKNLAYYYSLAKRVIKNKLTPKEMIIYYIISGTGYVVQSIPILFLIHEFNLILAVYVFMLYLSAELIPIPAGAGFAEYSLSIFLTPANVVRVRIFTLLSVLIGFIYINEIKLEELKKEFKNLKVDGSVSKG